MEKIDCQDLGKARSDVRKITNQGPKPAVNVIVPTAENLTLRTYSFALNGRFGIHTTKSAKYATA